MSVIGSIDLAQVGPIEQATTGRSRVKTGARVESDLNLASAPVRSLETMVRQQFPQLGSKNLRFASLMKASASDADDQAFHADASDASRYNAFVYLTDVPDAAHGPIEVAGLGPVLGPAGTAVLYNATEMHRGVANHADADRLAVAMAFADSSRSIDTIGGPADPLGTASWVWLVILSLIWIVVVVKVAAYYQ